MTELCSHGQDAATCYECGSELKYSIRPDKARGTHGQTGHNTVFQAAIADVVRYANAREDFNAQHGPCRILFKDGKPVA